MTEYFGGEKLSVKERAFVHYLITDANFVVQEAAKLAKYKQPGVSGAVVLARPRVQLAIEKKLQDGSISRKETLYRLSDIARGAMQYFLRDGKIDLESREAKEKRHLLKRVTQDTNYSYDKDGNVISETSKTTIEVYDALAALTILAKYHGLLQAEALSNVTNNTLVVNDWRAQAQTLGLSENEIIQEARAILQESSDSHDSVDARTVPQESQEAQEVTPDITSQDVGSAPEPLQQFPPESPNESTTE